MKLDKYARKIHYTCDMYFALTWALVTGFGSPMPWFYPVFFAIMITHRAYRDIQRCEKKYGDTWEEYKRQVPYLFIPVCQPQHPPAFSSSKVTMSSSSRLTRRLVSNRL